MPPSVSSLNPAPPYGTECRPPWKRLGATVKRLFVNARASHDWEHTQRVCRLCRRMGPIEGADMEVLLTASYLHDIGRSDEDASNGSVCHAEKGAKMADAILAPYGFSMERRENILHCIRSHRFRGANAPETIEAKVLFDADKLDAIGAVGIARAYLFAGEIGARLHNPFVKIEAARPYSSNDTGFREYKVKLSKIRDRMQTATGRRLAEDRHRFMEYFFQRFLEEHTGKR
jgi:uncharacterized protein